MREWSGRWLWLFSPSSEGVCCETLVTFTRWCVFPQKLQASRTWAHPRSSLQEPVPKAATSLRRQVHLRFLHFFLVPGKFPPLNCSKRFPRVKTVSVRRKQRYAVMEYLNLTRRLLNVQIKSRGFAKIEGFFFHCLEDRRGKNTPLHRRLMFYA